jgi:hypothetical protein
VSNGSLADITVVESPAQTKEIAVEPSQPTNSKTVRADQDARGQEAPVAQ